MINLNKHQSQISYDLTLRDLFEIIFKKKLLIFIITSLFIGLSFLYAITSPNIYKSKTLLVIKESDKSSSFSGLGSQLNGISSLAGLNLNAGANDISSMVVQTIKSRDFFKYLIEARNFKPELLASKSFNEESKKIIYDVAKYNQESNEWLLSFDKPLQKEPSLQESYLVFMDILDIEKDDLSGFITVSISHISPYFAEELLVLIIDSVNTISRERDLNEAIESMIFLNKESSKINNQKTKDAISSLMEKQLQIQMLANVKKEYIAKVLDSPFVPEKKIKPNRVLIMILGSLSGFLFSIFIALTIDIYRKDS